MFGRARPIGCLLTIGSGMVPNLDLGRQASDPFTTVTSTGRLVLALMSLADNSEQTHLITKLLVPSDAYYRFDLGIKIADSSWLEVNDPNFHKKWFGSESVTAKHRIENRVRIVVALDDYKSMDKFVALTKKYLEGEVEAISQCALRITAL
jgi:hypothetical protein